MDELIFSSATELARVIQTKEVSSLEVVTTYLERIDAVNPKLNAIVQLTAETALEQAREFDAALARGEIKGPLHGVPRGALVPGGELREAEVIPDRRVLGGLC